MAAIVAALAILHPVVALAQGSDAVSPAAEPLASASTSAPGIAPGALGSEAATRISSDDLGRLETLLKYYQAEEESYRLWSGLSAMATGSAMIPLGLVLNSRTGSQSWVGPMMLVAGVVQLAGGAGALIAPLLPPPTGFAYLTDLLARQRAAGRTPGEMTALIESEWERLAKKARSDRRFSGAIGLAGAPAVIGVGTYIMLAKPTAFSEEGRFGTSALLFGLGAVGLARSVYLLFVESNMEVAWNTYQLTARPRAQRVRFGYSPAPGGSTAQLAISF